MPPEVLEHLKKVWVAGQMLRMRRADAGETSDDGHAPPRRFGKPGPRPARKGNPAGKPRRFGPKVNR